MTDRFYETLNSFDKEVRLKIAYDNKELLTEIKSATFTKDAEIGNAIVNELKFTVKNYDGVNNDIDGKNIALYVGFRYEDGEMEFYHLKNWIVKEISQKVESNDLEVTAWDYMDKFNVPYEDIFTYPLTLEEYVRTICGYVGVEYEDTMFPNKNFVIESEPYVKESFKDALSQVASASLTIPLITDENKLKLTWFSNSDALIKDFSKIEENPLKTYDTVILGRGDVEDNIYHPKENVNSENYYRIDENYIVYFNREETIIPIYERLNGFSYKPLKIETKDCNFTIQAGDIVKYNTPNGVEDAYVNKLKVTYNGGLELIVESPEALDKKTNLSKAGTIGKKLVETSVEVDKINKKIEAFVNETSNFDERIAKSEISLGEISEKVSSFYDNDRETNGNPLFLKNATAYYPVFMQMKGNFEVINNLYPSDDIFPSSKLTTSSNYIEEQL